MKTDKLVTATKADFNAVNRVCDLMDEGYILISTKYDANSCWTQYHLRKTPFTWMMTKLSKKV